MKRALPFLLILVCICPHFAASQDTTARDDSSKSRKPRRRATLGRDLWKDNARLAAESARLAAEEVRLSAEMEMQLPFVMEESLHELHAALPHAMELVGPALEQVEPALEQAMQALDFSMQALQEVPWAEINAELATMPEIFVEMPPFMDMPPLPDIPPIPPLPVLAPVPSIPPLPPIPPVHDAPWPVWHGEDHGWHFEAGRYAENLTEDEQVHIQALAGLLSQDESTALPEIRRLCREHENWAIRAAAVSLLASTESSEALAILEEVLSEDANRHVRRAAVRALSRRPETEAREILKRFLGSY